MSKALIQRETLVANPLNSDDLGAVWVDGPLMNSAEEARGWIALVLAKAFRPRGASQRYRIVPVEAIRSVLASDCCPPENDNLPRIRDYVENFEGPEDE